MAILFLNWQELAVLDAILTARKDELERIVSWNWKSIVDHLNFNHLFAQADYGRYMMYWDGVDPENSPWEEDEREEYVRYKVRIQRNAEELVGGSPFSRPFWVSPALAPPFREADYDRQNEVSSDLNEVCKNIN